MMRSATKTNISNLFIGHFSITRIEEVKKELFHLRKKYKTHREPTGRKNEQC